MELVKDYMNIAKKRHLLNDMTTEIFGFTFEDWYLAGFYEGEYIPYSYEKNGEIIANASANIMKIVQNSKEKLYIQIGTVMTRPQYRKQGLASKLIATIISDYEDQVDGFYLYANLNALDFYKKIGFRRLDQWRYSAKICSEPMSGDCYKIAGEKELAAYRNLLRNAAINQRLDQINRSSLQLFYTGKMENVYCNVDKDNFIVAWLDGETLYLDSVITADETSVMEIIKKIPLKFNKVILGFTPKTEDADFFIAEKYDGQDDYRFFYMGASLLEIEKDRLYFPVMSHA